LKLPLLLLLTLFVFTAFPLFAQEEQETLPEALPETSTEVEVQEPLSEAAPEAEDERLYVISAFEFDIKGRTRPFALIYNGEFEVGETLKGQAELDKYIRDKTQILVNQRVLKDNAVISYSVGEQAEDGSYPVTLAIKVEDSWNLIALPRPQYSTNSGFELTIKARDYNFLGTMSPLRVDLGYRHDENGHNSYQFEVYSNTPFRALGYTWNLKFDNLVWYRPNVEKPFFYQNVTGLSMELPFYASTFTFGFEESLYVNEENSSREKEFYQKNFQDGLYASSKMYTLWKIPTGLMVSRYGELTYTPGIAAIFNHELPKWPLLSFHQGPFLDLSHSLGFEKIDWHANFRDGLSVSLSNSYSYDFYRFKNDLEPLSASLTLHGAGYFIISKFFAFSSRFQYRHWFYHDPDYHDAAGNNLRGIADKAIHADYMFSLNMDFPFRVLLFTPSKWFDRRKLAFFDVELQIAPVIDLALFHNPESDTSSLPKNFAASGGLEIIVFSDFMRNLYVRLGYTIDLKEFVKTRKFPDSGDHREFYLFMGHFY